MTPRTLAKKIAELALSKKASQVVIMDLRKLTDITDYFVICSGDSDIQVKAIADAIIDGTEKKGIDVWHKEGISQRQWILLDFVDVVTHVFHKDARKYYGLEKLWSDAKIEAIEDKPKKAKPKAKSKKK